MMVRAFAAALALGLLGAASAGAQDFGVMESAETIQRGNFKLVGYPVLVLGEGDADNTLGVVVRGGYGFTDRLDLEIGAAFYDGATFLGANAEYWLLRAAPGTSALNLSVRGGVHLAQREGDDATGLDLAALTSFRLTPRAELLAALDYTHTLLDEPLDDDGALYLVPGLEYGISRNLDFLAEFGLGLDDDAPNYLSAGLAFYLR
ncbi:MAG TPA: hypothetical protein VF615_10810 [Longimicrobiaceae bacterium]|jgi:hypothetical protein